jgi:Na+/melibiose symporter-like transporter
MLCQLFDFLLFVTFAFFTPAIGDKSLMCSSPLCFQFSLLEIEMQEKPAEGEDENDEDKTTSMSDYSRLLCENNTYRTLFIAYCIDNIGNWLTLVASITIIENLQAGALDVSLFLICRLLPSIIFAGVLGPMADRHNKLRLLIGCSLGSAISVSLLVFLIPFATLHGKTPTLALIYTLTLAQFTCSALYEPTRNSLLPIVVSEADLIVATSLDGMSMIQQYNNLFL